MEGMTAQNCASQKNNKIPRGPPWLLSSRFLLAVLSSWGYGNFFFQRINLSIAIVCMVNHTAVDSVTSEQTADILSTTWHSNVTNNQSDALHNSSYRHSNTLALFPLDHDYLGNSTTSGDCSARALTHSEKEDGELVWSKSTQGIVLGSLYLGYTLILMPSQRIIQKFGPKRVSFITVFVMSAITMVLPHAARASPWFFLVLRVVQGMMTGVGAASVYSMWGAWAPPQERNTLVSICFSGGMIASAIVYVTSGLLCRFGFAGGWPSVFYVFGIVGFVWCILWQLLVFDTPDLHPRIDPREAMFITASIGKKLENKGAVPWVKIFKSTPAWAVVIANVGFNWPFFMLLAVLPQYMKEVLSFDIASNGLYSTLPYIILFVLTNFWGNLCDRLQNRRLVSVTFVRKISTAIGCVIPGVLYVALSFLDCHQALTVVILISLAIGISGTNFQGFLPNPYDIAPKYATAILCLSNMAGGGLAFVSPYIVAALTEDRTKEQWQRVFFLTSAIIVFCCILYQIFGKGTQMEWTKDLDSSLEVPAKNDNYIKAITQNGQCGDLYEKAKGNPFTISSSYNAPTVVNSTDFETKPVDSTILEVPLENQLQSIDSVQSIESGISDCGENLPNVGTSRDIVEQLDESEILFNGRRDIKVNQGHCETVDEQQKAMTVATSEDVQMTSSYSAIPEDDSGISDSSESTRL